MGFRRLFALSIWTLERPHLLSRVPPALCSSPAKQHVEPLNSTACLSARKDGCFQSSREHGPITKAFQHSASELSPKSDIRFLVCLIFEFPPLLGFQVSFSDRVSRAACESFGLVLLSISAHSGNQYTFRRKQQAWACKGCLDWSKRKAGG